MVFDVVVFSCGYFFLLDISGFVLIRWILCFPSQSDFLLMRGKEMVSSLLAFFGWWLNLMNQYCYSNTWPVVVNDWVFLCTFIAKEQLIVRFNRVNSAQSQALHTWRKHLGVCFQMFSWCELIKHSDLQKFSWIPSLWSAWKQILLNFFATKTDSSLMNISVLEKEHVTDLLQMVRRRQGWRCGREDVCPVCALLPQTLCFWISTGIQKTSILPSLASQSMLDS